MELATFLRPPVLRGRDLVNMCDSIEALVVMPGFNTPLFYKVRTYNNGTYTPMLVHIFYYMSVLT